MKCIPKIFILLLFLHQPVYSGIKDFKFERFDYISGAIEERIADIKQDSLGFIWIATGSKIYRFDGNEFISYTENNFITGIGFASLFIDSKGTLWTATNNGVYRFNDTLNVFEHYKFPLESEVLNIADVVHTIVESKNTGLYYFLTEYGTVYSIDKDMQIRSILKLNVEGCKSMCIDKDDVLWISSNSTIFCYNTQTNYTKQIDLFGSSGIYDKEIWDMHVDDSILYVASWNSDIIVYNKISGESIIPPVEANINTYCILKDPEGKVMFGTSEGITYFDPRSREVNELKPDINEIKGLSNKSVSALFYDKQGNLWAGTAKGVNISYRLNKFTAFGLKNKDLLYPTSVLSITKDSRGYLWIGQSKGGIAIYDTKGNLLESIYESDAILPEGVLSFISDFCNDSDGNIWVGTYQNGLLQYNTQSYKIKQHYFDEGRGGIKGDYITSIAEDTVRQRIWLSVHGYGIDFYDKASGKFDNFVDKNKNLPINIINKWPYCVFIDSKQNLWIGSTYGAACIDIETRTYKVYNQESSAPFKISNDGVVSIYEDSRGRIWLGSFHGLNVILPDGSIQVFTTEHGLSGNHIVSIIEDNNGDIWAGTSTGLSFIQFDKANDYNIKSYTIQSGLHHNKFAGRCVYKDKKGNLYFGGKEGYTRFHPDSIEYNTRPPKVVFTDLKLFNKSVRVKAGESSDSTFKLEKSILYLDKLTLKQSQNVIGISFAALNFINPRGNCYAYFLEGFDKDWVYCGSSNSALYMNLPPGNYKFNVKAANNDGVWNETPVVLDISIKPPFLKSIYAIVLYALMVFALVLYIIKIIFDRQKLKLQSEQRELLNTLKTEFFVDVSHELKTPLSLIVSPLRNILERSQNSSKVQVEKADIVTVYRNVYRLLRITLQLLDFRKVELKKTKIKVARYDIVPFIYSIIQYFDYSAKAENISIDFQYDSERDLSFYFDPDKMDKVIYNILSNAINHSPENSTITVRVLKSEMKGENAKNQIPAIRLEIEDEGPGIDAIRQKTVFERFCESGSSENNMGKGTGIGLSMSKEYVLMHHGEIFIESPCITKDHAEKRGARFVVLLPADDRYFDDGQITADLSRHKEIIFENQLASIDSLEIEDDHGDLEYDGHSKSIGHKVLIIEDDPELRNHLKKELEKHHFIIEAKNGETGYQLSKEMIPDLVITDLMLPGINGYEVVAKLKKQQETSHIPIIMLTAKTEQSDEIEAYSTGADAFMKKPFHMKTLVHLIESLIENRIKLRHKFLSSYGIVLREVVPTETDEKFIEKFLKIIKNNIANPNLNVELFTRELSMSRAQLYKKLNAIANISVNLFIRKVRLNEACKLLEQEKYNISDVAFMVGFNNLPYFSKCFQEEYGVSPSKYIANRNKDNDQ